MRQGSCSLVPKTDLKFRLDPQSYLVCSPKLNFAKFTCFRLCFDFKILVKVTNSSSSYFVKNRIELQTSVQ